MDTNTTAHEPLEVEKKEWFWCVGKTACINDDALTLYTLLEPLKAAASPGSSAQMLLNELLFGCKMSFDDVQRDITTYYSLFLISVYHGSLSMVHMFLEHFAVDGLINQRTIIDQGETVKQFTQNLAMTSTPRQRTKITGVTALWLAVYRQHYEVARTLLDFGADINAMTSTGSTPLRAACYNSDLEMVKELRRRGADVNCVNIYGNTCLMLAANLNDSDVMGELLGHYEGSEATNVNQKAKCGSTALHFVVEKNHLGRNYKKNAVQLLFDRKAIYSANHLGMTPLMYAGMSSALFLIDEQTLEFHDRAEVANAWDLACCEVLKYKCPIDWNAVEIQLPGLPVKYKCAEIIKLSFENRERCNGQREVASVNRQYQFGGSGPEVKEVQTFEEMAQLFANSHFNSRILVQRFLTRERILGVSNPELVADRQALIPSHLNIALCGLQLAGELKQAGFIKLYVSMMGSLHRRRRLVSANRVRNVLYLVMSTLRELFQEPALKTYFDVGKNRADVFFIIQGFFNRIVATYMSDKENPNVTADTLRLLGEFRQFSCLPNATTCNDPLALAISEPRDPRNPSRQHIHELLTNQLIDFKVNLNRVENTRYGMVPLHHLMMTLHNAKDADDLALRMRFLARMLDRGAHPDIMDEVGPPGHGLCTLCGIEPCQNCAPARALLNSYVTLECLAARAVNKMPGLNVARDIPAHLAKFVEWHAPFVRRK